MRSGHFLFGALLLVTLLAGRTVADFLGERTAVGLGLATAVLLTFGLFLLKRSEKFGPKFADVDVFNFGAGSIVVAAAFGAGAGARMWEGRIN